MTKKKKSKKKGNKLTSRQLKWEILKIFKRHPRKRLNSKQILSKLKVANNRDSVGYALEKLVEEGELIALGDYKFQLKRKAGGRLEKSIHLGYVDMTRTGSAYIICEDIEDDVHIAPRNLNTAMDKDKVKIKAWTLPGRNRPEGEVLEVLERAADHFIGTIWMYPNYAVVTAETRNEMDILVDLKDTREAADGEKVIVKIKDWVSARRNSPSGIVTTVLGKAGTSDIEMKSILVKNGFQLDFPDGVIKESDTLRETISEEEIALRRDMREIVTFTIDPDTAKDFDDALSIQYLENGNCEIGVHIADVSHYVKPGTLLDKEAFKRSTSVYLVDRVLPMLPEKLSNELCSLRPKEDKLTFSAIFTFDKNNKIIDRWFGKTIIHSNHRFTYEQAQESLVSGEGEFASELKKMHRIASRLRKEKFKKGAINFDSEEVKFRLDKEGKPIDVYIKERKDAHLLIEDFMLLANREVATLMANKGVEDLEIPFVYRVHDEPDPDRVIELAAFARELGIEMNVSNAKEISRSYNKFVEQSRVDPQLKLLLPIAIRTMAKAVYTTENIGHYGLAFDYYTHFTSPIRRYSDVLVHRILEKNLTPKAFRANKVGLEEKCEHISKQERKAMEAERESIKYKQVEFLEDKIGEEFDAFISGIGDRGIFAEIKGLKSEGMISYEIMDEPFEIADSRLRIKGIRSGKQYAMGDEIRVRIIRTDLSRRQIDMAWVDQGSH